MKSIVQSSQQYVYESFAKMILMDFGMRDMPDTVLDLAKKGFDNLRRRTYDPEEMMKKKSRSIDSRKLEHGHNYSHSMKKI